MTQCNIYLLYCHQTLDDSSPTLNIHLKAEESQRQLKQILITYNTHIYLPMVCSCSQPHRTLRSPHSRSPVTHIQYYTSCKNTVNTQRIYATHTEQTRNTPHFHSDSYQSFTAWPSISPPVHKHCVDLISITSHQFVPLPIILNTTEYCKQDYFTYVHF